METWLVLYGRLGVFLYVCSQAEYLFGERRRGMTEGEFLATLEEIGWLDAVPPGLMHAASHRGGECVHPRSKVCLLRAGRHRLRPRVH